MPRNTTLSIIYTEQKAKTRESAQQQRDGRNDTEFNELRLRQPNDSYCAIHIAINYDTY